jgi:CopG family nickel-responsive transcriptional regulator
VRARRLTNTFHDHHDLTVSTLHVHLDHDACLEVNVLRGGANAVRHLSEHVIAERGVRHGRVVMIPAELKERTHSHGVGGRRQHLHTHVRRAG